MYLNGKEKCKCSHIAFHHTRPYFIPNNKCCIEYSIYEAKPCDCQNFELPNLTYLEILSERSESV